MSDTTKAKVIRNVGGMKYSPPTIGYKIIAKIKSAIIEPMKKVLSGIDNAPAIYATNSIKIPPANSLRRTIVFTSLLSLK